MIGGCYPFPWHNAWQSYADAGGTIQPAGRRSASEPFAKVRCEVIAVLRKEIVGGAEELLGGFVDERFQLFFRSKREAMEDCLSEGSAGRFLTRSVYISKGYRLHIAIAYFVQ